VATTSPNGKPGDYVRLRAEMDVCVIMSACPSDIAATNAYNPGPAEYVVESGTETKV
jgi:hypothetical protein